MPSDRYSAMQSRAASVIGFLDIMNAAQAHLCALRAVTTGPLRLLRVYRTPQGWVVVYSCGEDEAHAFRVDETDADLRIVALKDIDARLPPPSRAELGSRTE